MNCKNQMGQNLQPQEETMNCLLLEPTCHSLSLKANKLNAISSPLQPDIVIFLFGLLTKTKQKAGEMV